MQDFVIWYNNVKVYKGAEFISDNNTKNYAEYYALLIALKKCNELNIKNLIIKCHSELIIQQFNKKNINPVALAPLYLVTIHNAISDELTKLFSFKFIHISYENNKDASFLANQSVSDYIVSNNTNLGQT